MGLCVLNIVGFLLLSLFVTSCKGTVPQQEAATKVKVIENISYRKSSGKPAPSRETLDLYLPPSGNEKPPLLVFVHGGFWVLSDDTLRMGASLADELVTRGVAVALVRYRLGPAHQHPVQVEDVAAAVAYLLREADHYGYDSKRIYLAGHSAGAHLASLIALDARYLSVHNMAPHSLAGVIGISGIYNLSGRDELSPEQRKVIQEIFGPDVSSLRNASPAAHVKPGAPQFLLLSASRDISGFNIDARRFGQALNSQGGDKTSPMVISDRDHFSIVNLSGGDNPIRELMLDFLKLERLPDHLRDLVAAKRAWLGSSPSTVPFWKHQDLVRVYPMEQRLLFLIIGHYGPLKHELLQWPLEEFHAMDLFAFLDALPVKQVGEGDYLVLSNLRNERIILHKKEIAPYHPVVVIGIDDERNLFQMSGFYRMEQEYSWKAGPQPPTMARPVGAFLYFLKPPPPKFRAQSWHFALTEESFRLEEENPLVLLDRLPRKIVKVLTHRNGCIYCHSFRRAGSKSHHVLVSSGTPYGGFALPLEDYPQEVWKRFIFDQEAVAEQMGANPNIIEESVRRPLYDMVEKYRDKLASGQ